MFFDETLPSTEDYHVSEDIEWYLRALKWSDAIVVERVLAEYHRRSGSISEKPGRLRIGDVKLGERVAKTPGRYATGAAEAFREHRRYQQRHAAVYYLKELDFARARAILRDAQSERFRAKDMVLGILAAWADKPLGRRAASIASLTWRRAIKPTLKTLASPFT